MNIEDINIPADAPVDEAFVKEANAKLTNLSGDIMKGKLEETKLIQESAMNGGPSSVGEAIVNLIVECNISPKALARRMNIPTKVVKRILNGESDMTPEMISAVYDEAKRRKPELFAFEKG